MKIEYKFFRKYIGKHIGIVDDKVVAVDKNCIKVYRKAIKNIPKDKKVGIYYLPSQNEMLIAV